MEISKSTEYFMRDCVRNKGEKRYETAYKILLEELLFWDRYDFMNGTNRKAVFEHLYLKPQYFEDAEKKKCRDLNISESTRERYRKVFISMFLYISSQTEKAEQEKRDQSKNA